MTDVYMELGKHLDKLPAGFPSTESGVELRILKRLFTPEEANIALGLNMIPEPVSVIAERMGRNEDELAPQLRAMSEKGLVFRASKGGKPSYMATQFVIGIWEYHVNDLNKELIEDVNEYLPIYMQKSWVKHETKQLRVIPVSTRITAGMTILPYEVAEEIIRGQKKIVISDCICRKEHAIMGKGCGNLLEACLSFGTGAFYYEENGLGRAIDQEEALGILNMGREAGLVLQPGNSRRPTNICMCCGCCCQVLKNLKTLESPALAVHSNYYAGVDEAACIGCEACVDRCHMDAVSMQQTAVVDPKRCIGCGVCVSECPTGAMRFEQKDPANRYVPPANVYETYIRMARERGNLSA